MSTPNSNFTLTKELYTAVKDAFGMAIGRQWKSQIERLDPLFSLIASRTTGPKGRRVGNFNTQSMASDETGEQWWVTHKVAYDEVAGITADTVGKDPTTLPNAFPNWDNVDGLTRAKFQAMYYERPVAFSVADLRLIGKGKGGVIETKKKLIMGAMRRALADQVNSSVINGPKRLLGVGYLFSTSNSPGGISQADNTWWRPGYLNAGASGALTWQTIDKYQNRMSYLAQSDRSSAAPDLVLLSTAGTHDLWSAFTQSIMTTQRVINSEFKEKFGYAPMMWGDANVLPDPRMAEQTVRGLNSANFYFTGSEEPEVSESQRIIGSNGIEFMLSGLNCLSVDEIKTHYQVTGHTA